MSIETPPVPLQNVGRRIAAPKGSHDPNDNVVHRSDVPADKYSEQHHHERAEIAQPYIRLRIGIRVDVALIDVVDEVRRRGVNRGRKIRHIGRQQSGNQKPEQSRGNEASESFRKNALKIHVCSHGTNGVAEEHQCKHSKARDQEVTWEGQYHVDPTTHHGSLSRILAGEHTLHVVVGSGPRRADQNSLEQQHHYEKAEESIVIFGNLGVSRGNQHGPVHVQMPADKNIVPSGGNETVEHARRNFHHGDDANRKGCYRQNAELHDLRDHNAEHSTFDHIKGGDGDQDQRIFVCAEVPGEEGCCELSDPLKPIGKKADDAEESVDYD